MSRHRIVRNMNIAEELDDEAMSDGGDDEISQEDQERLEEGLEQIRDTIGSEAQSGITDHEIKDALWNSYYDIAASIELILEERDKRNERKVNKPLPQLPVEAAEFITQPHRVIQPMRALALDDEGSHVIRLDVDGDEEFYYEVEQEGQEPFRTLKKPSLTTISERSERTEDSYEWAQYTPLNPGQQASSRLSWGSTTDYGQILERPSLLDPNTIPPSPTPSALQRLSIPEPPPSASSTGSRTPIAQSTPLPGENLDEEDAATPRMHLRGLEDAPQGAGSSNGSKVKALSKLSSLAHSRSNLSSHTSGSYTIDSGSVATYPPLRPSSQSNISLLTESSVTKSSGTGASSMSSHVRRALETALQMEALDALSPSPPVDDPNAKRPSAPVPEGPYTSSGTSARPVTSPPAEVRSRPTSKLSQLAHTRSVETVPPSSTSSQSKPVPALSKLSQRAEDAAGRSLFANSAASAPPNVSRPVSKLSQLAQAKGLQGSATLQRGVGVPSSDSPSQASTARPGSKLSQLARAKTAQAGPTQSQTDSSSVSSQSPAGSRPTSKLAQLAQARAQQSTAHTPPLDTSVAQTAEPVSFQTAPSKPSKLAQLAQAKAFQSQQSHWMPPKRTAPALQPGLTVHQSHTEYLTPIANGPTATTAITTTYQSLGDLGRPQRSEPATRSMNMFAPKHHKSSAEPKQSKLAMKSKRAQQLAEPEPEPVVVSLDPIFLPSSPHSLAPPSAFASVLVHDDVPSEDIKSSKSRGSRDGSRSHKHRSSRHHEVLLPPASLVPVQTFAFDVPSPDDIVFNARRNTALGQRPSKRPSPAASTSPSRASVASVSTLRV